MWNPQIQTNCMILLENNFHLHVCVPVTKLPGRDCHKGFWIYNQTQPLTAPCSLSHLCCGCRRRSIRLHLSFLKDTELIIHCDLQWHTRTAPPPAESSSTASLIPSTRVPETVFMTFMRNSSSVLQSFNKHYWHLCIRSCSEFGRFKDERHDLWHLEACLGMQMSVTPVVIKEGFQHVLDDASNTKGFHPSLTEIA